ncbi:MAG: hypothetical protein KKF56_04880 [Nanoarchaeota archaeon]|nr:hypothetical protein [Nanoarchaeota archaeon]
MQKLEQIKLPKELEKEVLILYELGLEQYEIDYLLYIKTKNIRSSKWEH